MRRLIGFVYGIAAYFLFFATFLYAIGFVSGVGVPKTINTGEVGSPWTAIVLNLVLMSIFAVQHSVMARRRFKSWWTQFVSPAIERSTYVLAATLALALMMWQWRPLPAIVWHVSNANAASTLYALEALGWVLVLSSTFLINHFELFGLHQVTNNLAGRAMPAPQFRMPLFYKVVRHPIYLGFIIAFWAAPTMSLGRLVFASVTTTYIFVGILLEERDLVAVFGDDYRRYRQRVGMILPLPGRRRPRAPSPAE